MSEYPVMIVTVSPSAADHSLVHTVKQINSPCTITNAPT